MRHLLLRLDDSHGKVDVNNRLLLKKRVQNSWKIDLKKNSDVHDGYVVYNGKIIEKFKILGLLKRQDGSNRRILNLNFVNSTKKGKQIKFTHDNYPNSVMYVDDDKLNSLMFIKKRH